MRFYSLLLVALSVVAASRGSLLAPEVDDLPEIHNDNVAKLSNELATSTLSPQCTQLQLGEDWGMFYDNLGFDGDQMDYPMLQMQLDTLFNDSLQAGFTAYCAAGAAFMHRQGGRMAFEQCISIDRLVSYGFTGRNATGFVFAFRVMASACTDHFQAIYNHFDCYWQTQFLPDVAQTWRQCKSDYAQHVSDHPNDICPLTETYLKCVAEDIGKHCGMDMKYAFCDVGQHGFAPQVPMCHLNVDCRAVECDTIKLAGEWHNFYTSLDFTGEQDDYPNLQRQLNHLFNTSMQEGFNSYCGAGLTFIARMGGRVPFEQCITVDHLAVDLNFTLNNAAGFVIAYRVMVSACQDHFQAIYENFNCYWNTQFLPDVVQTWKVCQNNYNQGIQQHPDQFCPLTESYIKCRSAAVGSHCGLPMKYAFCDVAQHAYRGLPTECNLNVDCRTPLACDTNKLFEQWHNFYTSLHFTGELDDYPNLQGQLNHLFNTSMQAGFSNYCGAGLTFIARMGGRMPFEQCITVDHLAVDLNFTLNNAAGFVIAYRVMVSACQDHFQAIYENFDCYWNTQFLPDVVQTWKMCLNNYNQGIQQHPDQFCPLTESYIKCRSAAVGSHCGLPMKYAFCDVAQHAYRGLPTECNLNVDCRTPLACDTSKLRVSWQTFYSHLRIFKPVIQVSATEYFGVVSNLLNSTGKAGFESFCGFGTEFITNVGGKNKFEMCVAKDNLMNFGFNATEADAFVGQLRGMTSACMDHFQVFDDNFMCFWRTITSEAMISHFIGCIATYNDAIAQHPDQVCMLTEKLIRCQSAPLTMACNAALHDAYCDLRKYVLKPTLPQCDLDFNCAVTITPTITITTTAPTPTPTAPPKSATAVGASLYTSLILAILSFVVVRA